ncbi:MAG: endolytic transglycosylase MltG, partial [bacterium]|nr:endolytic transglycosylase MltG [bacterium]
LRAVLRLRNDDRAVQAGDYLLKRPRNIFAVARIIANGEFGLEPRRITIPEGATVADMSSMYSRHLLRFDPETFFEGAIEFEGYLFPDTYYFLPNATEEAVIETMRDNFNRRIAGLAPQIEASGYTLHEVVTMASLIEKEARNERDRRLISGVLWNRFERNMLLQVDATFIYTHGKGTYDITLAELLDKDNLYNTYAHAGLPPGPIAAPSESSLRAAINPIESDYLFYLADRSGTTYYSETYEEHLRKKQIYVD